jgi:hypothetical protein
MQLLTNIDRTDRRVLLHIAFLIVGLIFLEIGLGFLAFSLG